MADPTADVLDFLSAHERGRPQRAWVNQEIVDFDYEDEMVPETEQYPIHNGQYALPRNTMTSTQSDCTQSDYATSNHSSNYDYGQSTAADSYAYTTISTQQPPRHVPFDEVMMAATHPIGARWAPHLPCEFVGINDCTLQFNAEETEAWIYHIAHDHLHDHFAKKLSCWYCDDVFDHKDFDDDRYESFYNRMVHIRDHIVHEGHDEHRMRPDYNLAKHLKKHHLISEQGYHAYMRYSEPMPSHLTYPGTLVPYNLVSKSKKGGDKGSSSQRESKRSSHRDSKESSHKDSKRSSRKETKGSRHHRKGQ